MSCIQAESSVPTAEEIVAALRTDPELCREVILTALMSDLSFRQEEEQRPMGNGRTGGSVGSIGPSEDVAVNRIYHLIADATDPVLESDAQIIAARAMVWAAIMSADGIGSELTVEYRNRKLHIISRPSGSLSITYQDAPLSPDRRRAVLLWLAKQM